MKSAVLLLIAAMVAGSTTADLAAAGRSTRWTPREVVLSSRHRLHGLEVGIGPRRYAVLKWLSGEQQAVPERTASGSGGEGRRVWVAVRRTGSDHFGEPRPLSGPGAMGSRLEMARNGQTIITWLSRAGRVKAAFHDPKDGWHPTQTLTGPDNQSADLAVGADGTAIAAWRVGEFGSRTEKVVAAVRPPHGRFGKPVTIGTDPGIGNWGPVPAVGAGGRGLLAWTGRCPLNNPEGRRPARVVFLRKTPGPTRDDWGGMQRIEGSRCPTAGIEAAMASDGTSVIVLNGRFTEPPGPTWGGIRAALRIPGEGLGPAVLISRRGQRANFAELGVSMGGKAVVVWSVYDKDSGAPRGLLAVKAGPGGQFTDPRRISPRKAAFHDLAVGGRGHAVVVWHALGSGRIGAAYLPRSGWFGDPEIVSEPITTDQGIEPVVAINGRGRAIAGWGRPDRQGTLRGVFVSNRIP